MATDISTQATRYGDTVHIDLWYPGAPGSPRYIQVGLTHVRAADDIRISYDFDRDGYKIEQAEYYDDPDLNCSFGTGPDGESIWREVAFVQAWALERPKPEPTDG